MVALAVAIVMKVGFAILLQPFVTNYGGGSAKLEGGRFVKPARGHRLANESERVHSTSTDDNEWISDTDEDDFKPKSDERK